MSLDNKDAFLETMAKYPQVKTIIYGHAHQDAYTQFEHIDIYGAPSTCTQFKPECTEFTLDDLNAGYRVLHLHADGSVETNIERIAS